VPMSRFLPVILTSIFPDSVLVHRMWAGGPQMSISRNQRHGAPFAHSWALIAMTNEAP